MKSIPTPPHHVSALAGTASGAVEHPNVKCARQRWMQAALATALLVVQADQNWAEVIGPRPTVTAQIDVGNPLGPYRRIHDSVTPVCDARHPLPFQMGDSYFRRFQEAQFRWARLMAISPPFCGVQLSRDDRGKLVVDYSCLDAALDLFKAAGAEPFLRIAYFTPAILRPSSPDRRYAGVEDLDEWEQLVHDIVHHVNIEQGYNVKYWIMYLNEAGPDVMIHKTARADEMHQMYERAVIGGLRADPSIKVGGPALAWEPFGPVQATYEPFLRSFLEFVRDKGLPLDFFCYHYIGRCSGRPCHPIEHEELTRHLQAVVGEYLNDRHPEFWQDEYTLTVHGELQDSEFSAAYLAAGLHYLHRAGVTRVTTVWFNKPVELKTERHDVTKRKGPFQPETGGTQRFALDDFLIDGQSRPSLVLTPPKPEPGHGLLRHPAPTTYGRYRLPIPDSGNSRLMFATPDRFDYDERDTCRMEVVVESAGSKTTVFAFHPARGHQPQQWADHQVDLSAFAGKTVEVELRSCGSRPFLMAWANPRVVHNSVDGEDVVYDFLRETAGATTGAFWPAYEFNYDADTIVKRYTDFPLLKGPVVTANYFTFYAYSQLQHNELAVHLDKGSGGISLDNTVGVVATRGEKEITILLWRFDPDHPENREMILHLSDTDGAFPNATRFSLDRYLIDRTHSNAYYDYAIAKKATSGGRFNLDTAELAHVQQASISINSNGGTKITAILPNLSVTLLRLKPVL